MNRVTPYLCSRKTGRTWFFAIIGIILTGFLLRGWASLRLPLDFDEPIYLRAAFDYAEALNAGSLVRVIDYPENREHPALGKLLYAAGVMALGQDPDWTAALYVGRVLSAVFGTLAVLLLALFDPVAGGLLAVHTLAIKYTSQVYLEALPLLASLAAVLAFERSKSARDRWYWLSALSLGVTAAGKLSYLPIIFVILYLAIWEKRTRWRDLLLYFVLAGAAFWLLNPTLWRNPVSRLSDALFFHARYSQGSTVEQIGYPWHRPLYWISRSPAATWHPEVFFYFALDGLIFLLALGGLFWEWRARRWVVVWILTSLLTLLIWPTKWPQYTLVLTPALCLSASSAVRHSYRWLREKEILRDLVQGVFVRPPRSFWIATAVLVFIVVVAYSSATVQLALGRLGWLHYTRQRTLIPSNTVYDIVSGPGGQMILGTERGAVVWSPPATTDSPGDWEVFTTENSSLPHNRVSAVTVDKADHIWFGTEAGVAHYDGNEWHSYRAENMGLLGDAVNALALGSDDRLWVGTDAGAAVFDGETWMSYTSGTTGLVDNRVLSLAIEPQPEGDMAWFGSEEGISRLDTATNEWTSQRAVDLDLEWGGVADLMIDSSGRLWVGTLGAGLGRWDGSEWHFYRTANSDIPFNTVNEVTEVEPGVLWVGTALPSAVGGVLAEFDGESWKAFTSRDSGYSGGEPLAIEVSADGRRWIGTRTAGVDVFQSQR